MLKPDIIAYVNAISRIMKMDLYVRCYPDNSGGLVEALTGRDIFTFHNRTQFVTLAEEWIKDHRH